MEVCQVGGGGGMTGVLRMQEIVKMLRPQKPGKHIFGTYVFPLFLFHFYFFKFLIFQNHTVHNFDSPIPNGKWRLSVPLLETVVLR